MDATTELGNEIITIYPNPNNDVMHVSGVNFDAYQLVDTAGNKMNVHSTTSNLITVAEDLNGLYFITLFNRGEIIGQTKVLIQK